MVLMAAVVMFSGCGKDDDDDAQLILGKWSPKTATYTHYSNGVKDSEETENDFDDDEAIEFFDNGKVSYEGESGTYKISGKTLTITEDDDKDDPEIFQITSLTKKELIVTQDETDTQQGQTSRYVDVMTFIKN